MKSKVASWFGLCALALSWAIPTGVRAADITVPLEVPIGGARSLSAEEGTTDLLKGYIVEVYEFIVGGIGVVAVVAIMYWGFRWVTAAGNQTIIGNAKEGIQSALIGLVIALTSYTILALINPALVALPSATVSRISFPTETENNTLSSYTSSSMSACMADAGLTDAGDPNCSGLRALNPAYTTPYDQKTSLTMLPAAAAQWDKLAEDFHNQFGIPIRITHAFRSPAYQQCLVITNTGDSPAKACESNHNGGAAIDINDAILTQAQYNWIVCGQEDTCPYTAATTGSGRAIKQPTSTHFGFRVLNYNDNKAAGSVWEEHHFDYATSSSTKTNVCTACPGLTLCGC